MLFENLNHFDIWFQWYYWLVNIFTFGLFALDKRKAYYQQSRIPEFVLLLFSFLGGALGAICAMYLFRHKTRNPLFYISVPILLVLQIVAYAILAWYHIL